MREDLEEELQTRYIFMRRSDMDTIYEKYGCQCENGWYNLIDETCSRIQAVYDEMLIAPSLKILQIKEKFGTLRFYFELPTRDETLRERITRIVDEAQVKSAQICERCGSVNREKKIRTEDYYQTLCDACFQENIDEDPEEVFTKYAMRTGRMTLEDFLNCKQRN